MDTALSVPLRLTHTLPPQLTPHKKVLSTIRSFLSDYAQRTGSSGGLASSTDATTSDSAGGSSVLSSQLSRLATGLDPNSANVMAIFEQFENIGAALDQKGDEAQEEEEEEEAVEDETMEEEEEGKRKRKRKGEKRRKESEA